MCTPDTQLYASKAAIPHVSNSNKETLSTSCQNILKQHLMYVLPPPQQHMHRRKLARTNTHIVVHFMNTNEFRAYLCLSSQ